MCSGCWDEDSRIDVDDPAGKYEPGTKWSYEDAEGYLEVVAVLEDRQQPLRDGLDLVVLQDKDGKLHPYTRQFCENTLKPYVGDKWVAGKLYRRKDRAPVDDPSPIYTCVNVRPDHSAVLVWTVQGINGPYECVNIVPKTKRPEYTQR